MFDSLFRALWAAILPAIVAALLTIFGGGCDTLNKSRGTIDYGPDGVWINILPIRDDIESQPEPVLASEPDD